MGVYFSLLRGVWTLSLNTWLTSMHVYTIAHAKVAGMSIEELDRFTRSLTSSTLQK